MRCFVLAVMWVAVTGVTVADEPEATVAKARETFTGTWEIAGVKPGGATKDARRLVFDRDGNYAALDKDGKELWAGTFEIDPTAIPKVWDHRSRDAKKEGKDVLGIYELEGEKMKVACVVGQWKGKEWVGRPRPKGFDPKHADVVIELKRLR